MSLNKLQKYKLFQRLTGWSRDKIRLNNKAVEDLLSDNDTNQITADDITPELLDNEQILIKIKNWGLSDEQIQNIPLINNLVLSELGPDEDLLYVAEVSKGNIIIDGINYSLGDNQEIDGTFELLYQSSYDYIAYRSDSETLVLKIERTSADLYARSIDNCFIFHCILNSADISIGFDSY